MKILFINGIGRSKFGGGERWFVNAAKGLQELGHSVTLACRPGSMLESRAQTEGIPVFSFNVMSNISPYQIGRLARFLRSEKFDVVLSKNREFGLAAIASRIAGIPVVVARHGLPIRKSILKHRILLNLFAAGIIVNANSTKTQYIRNGWFNEELIEVIYNGVEINPNCSAHPFELMHGRKKVVLSVGRLSHQKGFSRLIEAVSILAGRHNDFILIILGEGTLKGALLREVREKGLEEFIQFPGFAADINPYYKGCDIFVLSSLYEGLPNAVLEAMAYGKPVVVSDVNGIREVVEHGKNGIIVSPGKASDFAEELNRLLTDENLRDEYGRNARNTVQEKFNLKQMVKNLEKYFHHQLSKV